MCLVVHGAENLSLRHGFEFCVFVFGFKALENLVECLSVIVECLYVLEIFMGMSFYFVNLSDFMSLVAKKMQKKKRKYRILIFWASLVGEENEEQIVLSSSRSSKKKKEKKLI